MWKTIQIVLGAAGLLLVFGGDRLSNPLLLNAGIACLGLLAMAVGWEAILGQHIVVGGGRSGSRGTYVGMPAVFRGIQFNLFGFFLVAAAALTYWNADGRGMFLEMVRRPGLPLIVLGMLVLSQAAITLYGSLEMQQGSQQQVVLNLLLFRLLPGAILVLVGLGAVGLGLFEVLAPEAFDARGGGFLEILYGLK